MNRPWLQPIVSFLVVVLLVVQTSAMDDSNNNEDIFLNLLREREGCTSGLCRRKVNEPAKITEKDAIGRLSNSYNDGEELRREKKRCMSWRCRLRELLEDDTEYGYEDHIMDEDKRAKKEVKPKRCLSWYCNDTGKRTTKNIEKPPDSPPMKKCMSWKCRGKREKESSEMTNGYKRKLVENLDSLQNVKRFFTRGVLKKQRDERVKCLSWDCKKKKDTNGYIRKEGVNPWSKISRVLGGKKLS